MRFRSAQMPDLLYVTLKVFLMRAPTVVECHKECSKP